MAVQRKRRRAKNVIGGRKEGGTSKIAVEMLHPFTMAYEETVNVLKANK